MNENRIQQVLEIERRAQEIHELAIREAQQLPISAEQESQALLEKARVGAQEEARQLVANAQELTYPHGLITHEIAEHDGHATALGNDGHSTLLNRITVVRDKRQAKAVVGVERPVFFSCCGRHYFGRRQQGIRL